MKDSEARGLVLRRLYDIRHEVHQAQLHHFDDLQFEPDVLANILVQLRQENLIDGKPHKSSSTGKIDTFLMLI